jgi:hypothetical protein
MECVNNVTSSPTMQIKIAISENTYLSHCDVILCSFMLGANLQDIITPAPRSCVVPTGMFLLIIKLMKQPSKG